MRKEAKRGDKDEKIERREENQKMHKYGRGKREDKVKERKKNQ